MLPAALPAYAFALMRGAGNRALLGTAILTLLALSAPTASAGGLASRVDPFAGTRPGPRTFGGGHNFPGAALPFGMVQWSPDTTPADRHGAGGYDYRDDHLRGFSLTHLSGAGCALYGDFPFLPTTEPLSASPARTGSRASLASSSPAFPMPTSRRRPGYYSVQLNPVRGGGDRRRTDRDDPNRHRPLHLPQKPALEHPDQRRRQRPARRLRHRGDQPQPPGNQRRRLQRPLLRPTRPLQGLLRRCLQSSLRRLRHLAAQCAQSRLHRSQRQPGAAGCPANSAAQEPTRPSHTTKNRKVLARVGISFVSVEGARTNLAAESRGRGFGTIVHPARGRWNQALGRIRVSGGPPQLLDTFYTALYHAGPCPAHLQ